MQREGVVIETVEVSQLGAAERELWRRFRAADSVLASPYFDLRFIEIAAQVAPGAGLAIVREGETIRGFLPFQTRGALLQPLAAPLSDFHGLIAEPGWAVASMLPRIESIRRARFSGLVRAGQEDMAGMSPRRAMAADLSGGFEAYLAGRDAAFLKDKRRRRRALERDHGHIAFTLERPHPEEVSWVLERKRQQINRTHQYDVFACGWTAELVRRLADAPDEDFGLRLACLKVNGTLVAAELGLLSGGRYHLWFPVYERAYAKYSPGSLMTLDTLEYLAARGVTRVDFGVDADAYKHDFADPAEVVFEGLVERRMSSRGGDMRLFGAMRLARRFDRIVACEPGLVGQLRGGAGFLAGVARRYPSLGASLGAGLGMSLGLGLSLALLAD